MKDKFSIELPNERLKVAGYITKLLLLIHCFVFGILYLKSGGQFSYLYVIGALICAITLVLEFSSFAKHKLITIITFTVTSITWFATGNILFGIIILIFTFLGIFANRQPVVTFHSEGLDYPSFPPKKISWNEVNNVILKDRVLTIDLASNKLIQVVLTPTAAASVNTVAFNSFCQSKIIAPGEV